MSGWDGPPMERRPGADAARPLDRIPSERRIQELRDRVRSGTYEVDAAAVAAAILSHPAWRHSVAVPGPLDAAPDPPLEDVMARARARTATTGARVDAESIRRLAVAAGFGSLRSALARGSGHCRRPGDGRAIDGPQPEHRDRR
jgi:hypothetical protein